VLYGRLRLVVPLVSFRQHLLGGQVEVEAEVEVEADAEDADAEAEAAVVA
jgi:hypothetical protein